MLARIGDLSVKGEGLSRRNAFPWNRCRHSGV